MAENWGGEEAGYSLAACSSQDGIIPSSACDCFFEFYAENNQSDDTQQVMIKK